MKKVIVLVLGIILGIGLTIGNIEIVDENHIAVFGQIWKYE